MATLLNEAAWDRTLRLVIGILFLVLGFGRIIGGTWGTVLGIVGLVALVTGFIGWCPAYSLLHIRTCKQTPPTRPRGV